MSSSREGQPDGMEPADPQDSQPGSDRWAVRLDAVSATLDRIGDLQRQICALQAEQVAQVACFVDQRNALDADLGVPLSPGQYRSRELVKFSV